MSPRRIAHLDMDAFYASVELLRQPELKGQPVVIGGGRRDPARPGDWFRLADYKGRGVATTCTYEARAFGVRSGMGLMKAAALCPQAILLPLDFAEYRRLSQLFKAAILSIAPVMEDRGIDEVYIDLTDLPHETRELAQSIKDAVREATQLTCSVGVAPNKLLAKICSDLEKPNGLTLLSVEDIPGRIWPLEVKKINGIGPKTTVRLAELGIDTIGALAACPLDWLIEHFGQNGGRWMHNAAHGRDERPVVTSSEPKSISRETTFDRDLHPVRDRALLTPILVKMCEQLAGDLVRKGYAGRTIGIKLRFEDFVTVTRDRSLGEPTQDAAAILRAARDCLKRVPLDKRLRLLGVRAGSLSSLAELAEIAEQRRTEAPPMTTLPLFDDLV